MTPKCPFLYMHNCLTNGKVHVFLDKQLHVDTIVSLDFQSRQVLESGASPCRVMLIKTLLVRKSKIDLSDTHIEITCTLTTYTNFM